jgi:hypothetical protein
VRQASTGLYGAMLISICASSSLFAYGVLLVRRISSGGVGRIGDDLIQMVYGALICIVLFTVLVVWSSDRASGLRVHRTMVCFAAAVSVGLWFTLLGTGIVYGKSRIFDSRMEPPNYTLQPTFGAAAAAATASAASSPNAPELLR